jgi:hypothetical protein
MRSYDVPGPQPAGDELRSGLAIATVKIGLVVAIVKIQSLEMRFQYRERMR